MEATKTKWLGPKALLDELEEEAVSDSMKLNGTFWDDLMASPGWLRRQLRLNYGKSRESLVGRIAKRFSCQQ